MSIRTFIKKHNINKDFMLFTVIVAAICFLYYNNVYNVKKNLLKNKQVALTALKIEIDALSQAGGDLKEKKKNLKELQDKYDKLEKEQEVLFSKFPNKAEVSIMLKDMITEEKFAGINFDSFYPSIEVDTNNGYQYIPIRIKISGNFNNIGEYIKYMENLPRIFIIDDLNFKAALKEDVANSCSAELKGKAYVLKY